MMNREFKLDHVGLATRDLERSRQAYEFLGFTLSPKSIHFTRRKNIITKWGSWNQLAMFEDGYFELLGLLDMTLPSNVKQMVEKYEGLHVLALQCDSADETYEEFRKIGIAASTPITLERDAVYGLNNEQVLPVQFRNIYLEQESYPEARYIFIEHRSREILWQPHLMSHRNGAKALVGVHLISHDLESIIHRLIPLFGMPVRNRLGYTFNLSRGSLWVSELTSLRQLIPFPTGDTLPIFAATSIRVRSLSDLRQFLKNNSIPYHEWKTIEGRNPSVWIDAITGDNAIIEFLE